MVSLLLSRISYIVDEALHAVLLDADQASVWTVEVGDQCNAYAAAGAGWLAPNCMR